MMTYLHVRKGAAQFVQRRVGPCPPRKFSPRTWAGVVGGYSFLRPFGSNTMLSKTIRILGEWRSISWLPFGILVQRPASYLSHTSAWQAFSSRDWPLSRA